MKRFIVLLTVSSITAFALFGCVNSSAVKPMDDTQTVVVKAQDAASKSLYTIGAAMQATPEILDALYDAGKLSKADYNKVVPIYNQVLASYNLAVNALTTSINAGQDPTNSAKYVEALNVFLVDKTPLDNLLTAFGQQPIGAGVSK